MKKLKNQGASTVGSKCPACERILLRHWSGLDAESKEVVRRRMNESDDSVLFSVGYCSGCGFISEALGSERV